MYNSVKGKMLQIQKNVTVWLNVKDNLMFFPFIYLFFHSRWFNIDGMLDRSRKNKLFVDVFWRTVQESRKVLW